jgi:hypothetical protein
MGSGATVQCPQCGYTSGQLQGIHGQIGMHAVPCETVMCPTEQELYDVWGPSPHGDEPRKRERCPGCGEDHPVWQQGCPKCGFVPCEIRADLMWD